MFNTITNTVKRAAPRPAGSAGQGVTLRIIWAPFFGAV